MNTEQTLKEIYEKVRNHQPTDEQLKMFRDNLEQLTFITGRVSVVEQIKEIAREKGIEL